MILSFRRAALAASLALSGAVGLAAPAAAQTSQPMTAPAAAQTAQATTAPAFSSSLMPTTPGRVAFSPNHVTGHVVAKNVCTSTHNTFTVVNRTRVAQQFKYLGQPYGQPIPASTPTTLHFLYDCQFQPGTYVFGVVGHPLAHLTVTVTP